MSEEEVKDIKETPEVDQDAEDNKGMGIVAYFIFFIPLLAAKDSKFAMYHANQGLLLLLTAIIINTVGTVVPIIGWLFVLPLGNLFVFVLWILGIINAAKGEKKRLPLIGKFDILT